MTYSPRFTTRSIAILALAVTAGFSSCKKDDESTYSVTNDAVSKEEASEIMVQALTSNSGGFAAQVSFSANVATTLPCDQQQTKNYQGQNGIGATTTYDYDLTWDQKTTCSNGFPQSYTSDFYGHSNYNAPKISSTDSVNAHFDLGGLGFLEAEYYINASYNRLGSQTYKTHNTATISSEVHISGNNLRINKLTKRINSGTASISASGISSSGSAFSYAGTVTFNGDNTATIELNGGGTIKVNM